LAVIGRVTVAWSKKRRPQALNTRSSIMSIFEGAVRRSTPV
jgi:hypothetical protein